MTTKLTRRAFVASTAMVLPFALRSVAQATKQKKWIFLGTDKGPGISRCSWDVATGRIGKPELAVKTELPHFFAMHPKLPRLYSVNAGKGAAGTVSSFHLDAASGALEFADRQSSHGDGPCFVSVDATGRSAFVANYEGGSFAAYPLGEDGSLKDATGTLDCRNNPRCGTPGPVHENQDAAHLHSATISPKNDFVLANDLGSDSIEVFPIQPGAANLLGPAQRVAARGGSGPRHLAFHPNGRWVYVCHELDCTVDLFDWAVHDDAASLRFREGSVVSTLRPGTDLKGNSGCEIEVSPDGRFVTTNVRGIDELLVFRIDQKTGMLTEQQRLSCGGKIPRYFTFDPSRRWLICANQGGSTVTVFAHDAATGKLSGPVQTLEADTPMFVQFI
jgi:6-phosphogluconolactonase